MSVTSVLTRMKGTRTVEEAAEALASEFRTKHAIIGALDVHKVARCFGAFVAEKEMQVDASLRRGSGGYEIKVSGKASATRKRFSVAHELGHIAIFNATGLATSFSHRAAGDTSATPVDPGVEAACDTFASELLMPRSEWMSITMKYGSTVAALRRLTRLYGVSREAAARRMVEVGAWRVAVVFWRQRSPMEDNMTIEAIRFFRKSFMTDESWPCATSVGTLMGEALDPRSLVSACTAQEFQLCFRECTRTVFGESGWLYSQQPVLATVVIGEPYPKSFRRQFPSEVDLSRVTDAQLLGVQPRDGSIQNLSLPFV